MTKEQLKGLWVQGLLMATLVATAMPVPDLAFAQNLAQAANNSQTQIQGVIKVLGYLAYAGGTLFAVSGLMKLKTHAENPTGTPLSHGIVRVSTGGALLALPYVMGVLSGTSNAVSGQSVTTFTTMPQIQ
jgi:hypothetical protein